MMPATVSPFRTTEAITPNSGSPAAKFAVPSTGSTTMANSARSSSSSNAGRAATASSPDEQRLGPEPRHLRPDPPLRLLVRLGHEVDRLGLLPDRAGIEPPEARQDLRLGGVAEDGGEAGDVEAGHYGSRVDRG